MNNPYVPTLINRGIMGFETRVIKKTWLQDRVYNNDVIACHYNIYMYIIWYYIQMSNTDGEQVLYSNISNQITRQKLYIQFIVWTLVDLNYYDLGMKYLWQTMPIISKLFHALIQFRLSKTRLQIFNHLFGFFRSERSMFIRSVIFYIVNKMYSTSGKR